MNRVFAMMRYLLSRRFLGVALCFVLSACSFVKLNDEAKAIYSSTVFVGTVSTDLPWDKP